MLIKSLPDAKKLIFLILIFFIFQILSFIGYLWPMVSTIVFWLIILTAVTFGSHKTEYGFLVLFFEFLSGHEGHMFEFAGISLRLGLFLAVMTVWLIKKIVSQGWTSFLILDYCGRFFLFLFLFIILVSFIQGLVKNDVILAIKDLINYSYFLLIFPLAEFLKDKQFFKKASTLSKSAIIGIGVLTVFIFLCFGYGLFQVHDGFYWWWRGVAIGKATDTGTNFFRIVTSAHLLILPLFLIILSFLVEWKSLKKNRKTIILLFFLASLPLVINFSRAYFLGILAGLVLLVCGLNWQRGLVFCLTVIFVLAFEFIFLFVIVNGGEALRGLSFFQSRLNSIAVPERELSSLSRMNILPKLTEKIKQEPIFGQGLGQTVSYFDPITNQEKQTFHLDWGYLEIWVETGLFGLLSYLMILAYIFKKGFEKIKTLNQDRLKKRLVVGLLSGLLALMVATITGPFLFHPLGIFYVILTILIIVNIDQYDAKSNNSNCHVE